MEKFLVKYALGGGFGGVDMVDGEILDFMTEEEADAYAREQAVEEYFSYDGMYGLFNRENELDENPSTSEADLDAMEQEDLESWIDWSVEKV